LKSELKKFVEESQKNTTQSFFETNVHFILGTDDVTIKHGVPVQAVYQASEILTQEIDKIIPKDVVYHWHGFLSPIANMHRGPNAHILAHWRSRRFITPQMNYDDQTADMTFNDVWPGTKIPNPDYLMTVAKRMSTIITSKEVRSYNCINVKDRFPVEFFIFPETTKEAGCQVPQDFAKVINSSDSNDHELRTIMATMFPQSKEIVTQMLEEFNSTHPMDVESLKPTHEGPDEMFEIHLEEDLTDEAECLPLQPDYATKQDENQSPCAKPNSHDHTYSTGKLSPIALPSSTTGNFADTPE